VRDPEELDLEDIVATDHPHVRGSVMITVLSVALVVAIVIATGIGAFDASPGDVVRVIGRHLGLGSQRDPLLDSVVWDIRIPRVLLAVVVGAALGCAGAAMQGAFANPLAEPGIIGVSSGAALGAVVAIVVGFALLDTWSVAAAAFVGGLITVAVVYFASRADGRTEVVTLILTGVALNVLTGAVIGLITYLSDDAELRSITFWTLGSVAQATWSKVLVVAPIMLVGVVIASLHAPRLDLLALGERSARHLGVDVERLRIVMLVVIALLTASAVAVSGIILFVGLVMPHIVRVIAGPRHGVLLPASALAGGTGTRGRRHRGPRRDRAVGDPARSADRAHRCSVLPLAPAPNTRATRWVGMRWRSRPSRLPVASAAGDVVLAALDVAVELGGRAVVDGVDLEVRAGEVVALIGPNGSGKSTLLAALAGDLPLARGSVTLDGAPLESWTPTERAMRRAVLPQHPVVTFPFTVGQVVRMGRAPWTGTLRADDDDRVIDDALAATDVAEFRRRPYTTLSGGEQARVMIARVLAQATRLLVLDEPTAALDLHHHETVLSIIRERAASGQSVLVVLHDLSSAAACADRVALLAAGRVADCGPPDEVLTPERLSTVYGHAVEVLRHPATGELIVLPRRDWRAGDDLTKAALS
jgi:iron complex transport system permease protein